MPTTLHVFLRADRVPTAVAWAQAIRDFGFTTRLRTDFEPRSHSGYVPCPDELTGFDLYVEHFAKANLEIGAATTIVGDRDSAATFRVSGREPDIEAAATAAASLAAMSDGVLLDDAAGHFIAADAAIAWARDEHYRPIAVRRARGRRRRSRMRLATLLRMLVLLVAIACIVFLWR